ncbi:MAG: SDR family oxidoreductase [Nitrospinae bacterium]|nr:SDR family oxidoreductase [Nitrospinota bacterium]
MGKDVLKGKSAFVSGATGGIGKAIAIALAERGCNLFLTASDNDSLSEVKNSLSSYNVAISVLSGNLTHKEEVYQIIEAARESMGSVDILINSAGVFPNVNLFDMDDNVFDETLDVNFRSAFLFSREFARSMVARKWGRIVNIGSSSAYSGFRGTSMYCASKHALLGFSRAIHDELKEHNVRTYYVSPSSTQSKMGLATKGQDYSTFLDPNDVAKYVVFAISFDGNIVSEEIFLKRMIVR